MIISVIILPMDKYEYVLFDWDGCLAKTLQVWMDAYKKVFAEYGVNPTEHEIAHHFGDWEIPKYFGIKNVEECINRVDLLADKKLKKVDLYEGAKELLGKLKKTKQLALLSSSLKEVLNSAVKHNGLTDYFKVILAYEDVQNYKPHPEIIEKGLGLLKGSKDKAIMIGDSRKDLEAANNAGVDSILVYPESHKIFYNIDDLKKYKPTFIISNIGEAINYL